MPFVKAAPTAPIWRQAESIVKNHRDEISRPLELVHTPNIHTIEDICEFGAHPKKELQSSCLSEKYGQPLCRAVHPRRSGRKRNQTDQLFGLRNSSAVIDEDCGLHAGYIGPYGLQEDLTVLFDRSLQGANNLCIFKNCL